MNTLASTESSSPLLREITNTDWVAKTFNLRFEVWNAETTLRSQVRAKGLITDDHDPHARHWGVFCGDEVVAAARMCIHLDQKESPDAAAFTQICLPAPVATINRLVVRPSARKLGLASKLCQCRIEAAKQDGAKCVVGTPVGTRIVSLEKIGFRLTGTEWIPNYAESLITHAMVLVF
jgi:GNAT superfamily N-acetyltransferase